MVEGVGSTDNLCGSTFCPTTGVMKGCWLGENTETLNCVYPVPPPGAGLSGSAITLPRGWENGALDVGVLKLGFPDSGTYNCHWKTLTKESGTEGQGSQGLR